MVSTTISLPNEIYKKLGHVAVDEEKGLSELMVEAIMEYIQRREKSP
jgi:predicted transcriptional regulator